VVVASVKSGTYGLPGSRERPRRGRVRSFPSAIPVPMAEVRACPWCSGPARQQGTERGPEIVCRGVRMIVAGALDGGTELELATRLGVSQRHLRRLFHAYLGATADQVARFHRAHRARRLLEDSGLSVTEIASAAGYGSLRQLNRAFQQVFHASPSQLRARRRGSGRLAVIGGLSLRLRYQGQLDWAALLRCLAAQPIQGVEHVGRHYYRRTVMIDGDAGVLELRPGGPGHLVLVAHLPHWDQLVHVVGRARQIAGLDQDVAAPARFLARDPLIGPLVTARPGVRVPGCWDPFEVGVRAIIGQHEPAADVGMQRMLQRLGKPVPELRPFGLTHCFPPAEAVAAAGPAELAALGLSSAAATGITAFADAVASGPGALGCSAGLDQLIPCLTSIAGVGSRRAHYIALRAGEPDAFPVNGHAAARAVTTYRRPVPPQTLGSGWRPWRALAATHLWLDTQQ
jgi:AraC family transcriptional regulator, regulatory protein of adaptative response / DNA-3-methyladenine glycosylase II